MELSQGRAGTLDFFVCDFFAPNPKHDLASMEHPLFSCFFHITRMPRSYWALKQAKIVGVSDRRLDELGLSGQRSPYLEGIYVKGRLAGIYSRQNYRDFWSRHVERALMNPAARNYRLDKQSLGNRWTGDPALRLGVNIVVYALTQEGGLARRLVAR